MSFELCDLLKSDGVSKRKTGRNKLEALFREERKKGMGTIFNVDEWMSLIRSYLIYEGKEIEVCYKKKISPLLQNAVLLKDILKHLFPFFLPKRNFITSLIEHSIEDICLDESLPVKYAAEHRLLLIELTSHPQLITSLEISTIYNIFQYLRSVHSNFSKSFYQNNNNNHYMPLMVAISRCTFLPDGLPLAKDLLSFLPSLLSNPSFKEEEENLSKNALQDLCLCCIILMELHGINIWAVLSSHSSDLLSAVVAHLMSTPSRDTSRDILIKFLLHFFHLSVQSHFDLKYPLHPSNPMLAFLEQLHTYLNDDAYLKSLVQMVPLATKKDFSYVALHSDSRVQLNIAFIVKVNWFYECSLDLLRGEEGDEEIDDREEEKQSLKRRRRGKEPSLLDRMEGTSLLLKNQPSLLGRLPNSILLEGLLSLLLISYKLLPCTFSSSSLAKSIILKSLKSEKVLSALSRQLVDSFSVGDLQLTVALLSTLTELFSLYPLEFSSKACALLWNTIAHTLLNHLTSSSSKAQSSVSHNIIHLLVLLALKTKPRLLSSTTTSRIFSALRKFPLHTKMKDGSFIMWFLAFLCSANGPSKVDDDIFLWDQPNSIDMDSLSHQDPFELHYVPGFLSFAFHCSNYRLILLFRV